MEMILKNIGKRIAECRRNKGFTQDDIANRLGITPQALSKWENAISSPDLAMLFKVCEILDVSSDFLLGINNKSITENGDEIVQNEIWNNLRQGLEPLELIFGEDIASLFRDNSFMDKIVKLRLQLSKEGILMPIVTVRDQICLKANEIMILAYQNVLYCEEIEVINENTIDYIIERLGYIVRNKYAEIINIDILKSILDNFKIKYPALIDEIALNKIPYGLILDVIKAFINRGNGMVYLPKILEIIERDIREDEKVTTEKLIEKVCCQLERKDNFWVVLGNRNNI